MENSYIQKLLELNDANFEIDSCRKINFYEDHQAFEGVIKKNPNDPDKILIISNPLEKEKVAYEFPFNAIGHIEEIETLTLENGQAVKNFRVWVKNRTLGVKHSPFIVK